MHGAISTPASTQSIASAAWPHNEIVRRLQDTGEQMTNSELISTYIRAKDSNRAHLMGAAFARDAVLEMIVNAGTISFPPQASGLDAITDVLVRRFGQTFENVYTFCLSPPPSVDAPTFSCVWLVGMSEKDGGAVRVGCGRYDWVFRRDVRLIDRLSITIEQMQVLPASHLSAVMNWLTLLPYPWCPRDKAIRTMPRVPELSGLVKQLEEMTGEDA